MIRRSGEQESFLPSTRRPREGLGSSARSTPGERALTVKPARSGSARSIVRGGHAGVPTFGRTIGRGIARHSRP